MRALISQTTIRNILLVIMLVTGFSKEVSAQYSNGTSVVYIGSGWTRIHIDGTDEPVSGIIFNLGYDKIYTGGSFSSGVSMHYILSEGDSTYTAQGQEYMLSRKGASLPVLFNIRYLLGSDAIKFYLRGSAGGQFTYWKRETVDGQTVKGDDFGFAGGFGAGAMIPLGEHTDVSLDYGILWIKNEYYREAAIQSFSLKFGFLFGG